MRKDTKLLIDKSWVLLPFGHHRMVKEWGPAPAMACIEETYSGARNAKAL